ncbi:unnamed protein product [Mucor hiemalis]
MRSVLAISAAIALFASSAIASNADFNPVNFAAEAEAEVAAVPLGETFSTFRWMGEESLARESFDVNVKDATRIQVTDYKNRGDMFEVFDNGVSLGLTTKVDDNKDEEVFAATPEEALNDDRFSKGVFDLAKGDHKITIKAVGPYEAGTAAIRVLDHSNVAFHKKKGDDDDKEDDEDDEDEDEEEDDDKDGKKWHEGDSKKKHHKLYPGAGLDLSHTFTVTKTKWVIQMPTVIATETKSSDDYHHKGKKHHKKGKKDYK